MMVLFGVVLFSGCTISSTEKRAALLGGGGAVGALIGNELGHGSKSAAIAGAVAGAGLSALAMGKDPVVEQDGFDQGYVRGQSDAIKRHYEMRMRAHRDREKGEDGAPAWYVVPGPAETNDGRKLEPHTVAIPIKE